MNDLRDFAIGMGNSIKEARQEGFQAGLKWAAEKAEFLSDVLIHGLDDGASAVELAYAKRKAIQIQQAILKEADGA